jgi:hypothetical protein
MATNPTKLEPPAVRASRLQLERAAICEIWCDYITRSEPYGASEGEIEHSKAISLKPALACFAPRPKWSWPYGSLPLSQGARREHGVPHRGSPQSLRHSRRAESHREDMRGGKARSPGDVVAVVRQAGVHCGCLVCGGVFCGAGSVLTTKEHRYGNVPVSEK